jgi:hypothetical protein
VSPVSKGRRRKPKKTSGRRTARRSASIQDVHLPDQSAGQETAERRAFVMPHRSTTIDGERYDHLDPADPDERSLLIQGEHPEFAEYLVDSSWQGEIDGTNPRFHLTMHEVIANQLWADEPPEVWQAAKRLREQGMERHDILHELVSVMTEHMQPTLLRGESFDDDAYRQALSDLASRERG